VRASSTGLVYAFEDFRLDVQRRLLRRASGGAVSLTSKAFDTLLYFVERPGELLRKRDLLEGIWPDVVVEENNLNQCISALRRALGERPGEHRFIVTDPGRGYRFVASVQQVPAGEWISDSPLSTEGERGSDPEPVPLPVTAPLPAQSERPSGQTRARAPRLVRVPGQVAAGAVSVIALLALAAVVAYWRSEPLTSSAVESTDRLAIPPSSVAVLPFEVIGDDPGQIADGLQIELINKLTQAGLNVKARAAVRNAGAAPDFATIASEQQVELILAGTLQRVGDQLKVTVQRVSRTGFVLPPPLEYTVEPLDIFRVQADIAANVAETLQLTLSATARQRFARRPTDSDGALVAYWQALGITELGARSEARELLESAIAEDPGFAEAHAQLALLSARSLIDWGLDPAPNEDPEAIHRSVEEHASRALALDKDQAVAYAARAEANVYLWRWDEAAEAFEEAYRKNPRDLDVLTFYSQFNSFRGDFVRAIELADRARALDPSMLYPTWLAYAYAGDVEAALQATSRQLEINEHQINAWLNRGFVEARRGNRDAAERDLRRVEELTATGARPSVSSITNLARGYSRIGLEEDARRLFQMVQSRSNAEVVSDGAWASAYLAIGDLDAARDALERAVGKIEKHEPEPGWYPLMLIKHNVLGTPALEESPFKELRERIRG
jgi:DNA-binding winged helix-turn-helix (wHTH) protein/TolB-like protein/Flp pilus assembly protein TadD